MTNTPPRVRFAPSPTGELHVGNARTALFNWLFAKHYHGNFILRIEDTDQVRTSRIFEINLLQDMAWLGIDWDEGPGKGGPYGPYHQSERSTIYRTHLERLIAAELVYPCYCTDEELEAERLSLVSRKMMPRYMGKCRHLTAEARRRLEAEGRPAAYRFHVPPGAITFPDLIRGEMRFEGGALGDFIIVRSNGIPAYNFAVVIDDHLMEITHVIRGEDHLSNTALQLLLYRALGFAPPQFAHHALILGRDRAKLSKRHGATAVREFRERGILPEVLLNYLALLGASFGEGKEVFNTGEMIDVFSLDRAGKSGAIFDEDKLLWLNSLYIRKESPATLAGHLRPFISAAGYDHLAEVRLHKIIEAVRDNLTNLTEIGYYLRIFDDNAYELSAGALQLLANADAREVMVGLLGLLDDLDAVPVEDDRLYGTLLPLLSEKTGLRGKKLFMPLRAAITGQTKGPELDRCFAVLGKTSLQHRLHKAIAAIS
ncbi:MAG: glutamate--tRNA ligase [Syntrophales bacterium]|jgi:nondiscriminating glutamyl-tRNA synthetase|nr:glutamate--tRNA ligase [Syntrophales bacterium]